MRQQRRIGVATWPNLPMAAAKPLDEENIILVEMRSNPALVGGEADHHIVDTPIGNETKRRDQVGNGGHMMVDRLHQQRPMALIKPSQPFFGQRTLLHLPTRIGPANQPRFNFLFARQPRQLVRLQRVVPVAKRIADQQRFFLPIYAQKLVNVEILKVHNVALWPKAAKCKRQRANTCASSAKAFNSNALPLGS